MSDKHELKKDVVNIQHGMKYELQISKTGVRGGIENPESEDLMLCLIVAKDLVSKQIDHQNLPKNKKKTSAAEKESFLRTVYTLDRIIDDVNEFLVEKHGLNEDKKLQIPIIAANDLPGKGTA